MEVLTEEQLLGTLLNSIVRLVRMLWGSYSTTAGKHRELFYHTLLYYRLWRKGTLQLSLLDVSKTNPFCFAGLYTQRQVASH